MKSHVFILVFALISVSTFAQTEISLTDSPYPLTNSADNNTRTAFVSLFDDHNTGNLHVFTTMDIDEDPEYFFTGTEIPEGFWYMIPRGWRSQLMNETAKAYTTYNIRGESDEYYIIRYEKGSDHSLVLYQLAEDGLVHMMDLASYSCMDSDCEQVDSWLQDVDGDTRLDIIQKTKSGDSVTTEVYKLSNAGIFARDPNPEVVDYKFPMVEFNR